MAAEALVCSFSAEGDWFFHHCFFGVAREEEAGCNAGHQGMTSQNG